MVGAQRVAPLLNLLLNRVANLADTLHALRARAGKCRRVGKAPMKPLPRAGMNYRTAPISPPASRVPSLDGFTGIEKLKRNLRNKPNL